MSTQYPGYPRLAKQYWRAFLKATLGVAMLFIFTGAIAALIVLAFIPDAIWFFVLAAVSLVLHTVALFIRDIHKENYEPNQTELSSPTILFAYIVLIGVIVSTLLLIGTGGAYLVSELLGWPIIVAAAIAAYYPVLDLVLSRRGWWTPTYLTVSCTGMIISTLVDIHRSFYETLPFFGKRHRPKS